MTQQTQIAFLGLGLMGTGMVGRLLDANFGVTVYNRNPSRAATLAQKGANVARSPRDAAKGASIVIAMLADDEASRAVWLGSDGALAGANPGTLLIECSTLSPAWVQELSQAASAAGAALVDAPVTGSRPQAAAGQLTFLAGGENADIERARPVLSVMGRETIPLGPVGSGAMMKLINNFVCGVQIVALAEALTMIERAGLQRDQAISVLTGGAPGSPLVKIMSERMKNADYTPNFHLKLMAKDLRYAIAEGQLSRIELATAEGALRRMEQAVAQGLGDKDFSAVFESIRQKQ